MEKVLLPVINTQQWSLHISKKKKFSSLLTLGRESCSHAAKRALVVTSGPWTSPDTGI